MTSNTTHNRGELPRTLGAWEVAVAGMALVVAASTLVTDFSGIFSLGWAFVAALGFAFLVNLLLALSAARLSARHPRAGALYHPRGGPVDRVPFAPDGAPGTSSGEVRAACTLLRGTPPILQPNEL